MSLHLVNTGMRHADQGIAVVAFDLLFTLL
jgi:hypothetical protein